MRGPERERILKIIVDILQRLQNEFGSAVEANVSSPVDAVDEIAPQVVAAPRDAEAARALLAWAGREKLAVIARGGGTRLQIGARPERFDIVISTRHLNQVVEHDVGNATVCAGSGISLRALDEAVRAQGQFVPLQIEATRDKATPNESAPTQRTSSEGASRESAHGESAHGESTKETGSTLGGVVAANAAGAARMKFGAPRDLVVGLDAALSNGRLVRSGSKVVKNVSGYDLNKIFVGSFGLLGLVTQVTLRLRPLDETSRTWRGAFSSWRDLESHAMTILDGAFEPTILQARVSSRGLLLVARFDGVQAAVEAQLNRLSRGDETESAPHEYSCGAPSDKATVQVRAVLPLRRAAWWAREAQKAGASQIVWDCGMGVVRASFADVPDVAALRALAEKEGGALVVERAPADLKTPEFVWGAPRSNFFLMKSLKQKFDAANIYAPGRFVGGL